MESKEDRRKAQKAAYYKANYSKNLEKRKAKDAAWYRANIEKAKASKIAWDKANPEKVKEYQLKKYNLTLEQYNSMLEAQKHSCAVCKRHESEFNRSLAVDHNHTTLKVRGLLCSPCNQAIGLLQDSRTVVQAIDAYLALHEGGLYV
jgi:hypothetical protein